jgi:hypothetical protein
MSYSNRYTVAVALCSIIFISCAPEITNTPHHEPALYGTWYLTGGVYHDGRMNRTIVPGYENTMTEIMVFLPSDLLQLYWNGMYVTTYHFKLEWDRQRGDSTLVLLSGVNYGLARVCQLNGDTLVLNQNNGERVTTYCRLEQ